VSSDDCLGVYCIYELTCRAHSTPSAWPETNRSVSTNRTLELIQAAQAASFRAYKTRLNHVHLYLGSLAMEKYRSTADQSTGVHPFIPATDPTPFALRIIISLVLVPIRLPILLLGLILNAAVTTTAEALSFASGTLSRPVLRLAHVVGLRLALFGLGAWWVPAPVLERPRVRGGIPGSHPMHGDLVFCNHASFLDPLYLALFYSPVFAVPTTKPELFAKFSLSQATLSALTGGCTAGGNVFDPATGKTLIDLADAAYASSSGPVVVFAEGTTTNGTGVLSFAASGGAPVRPGGNVFAMGLRYSQSRCETLTIGSPLAHVAGRIAALRSRIAGRAINVPAVGDMQRSVAVLAGVPALRLSAEARARFEAHWIDTQKGY
jgi:hypothetical protein